MNRCSGQVNAQRLCVRDGARSAGRVARRESQPGCCSAVSTFRRFDVWTFRSGFTLIELMVVVGIIIVLTAIAVPAVGPLLSGNEMAQMVNTLNGLATTAQSTAEATATPVGIRIERGYRLKTVQYRIGNGFQPYQVLRDSRTSGDRPSFHPYQQARLVQFSQKPPQPDFNPPNGSGEIPYGSLYPPVLQQVPDTRIMPLPGRTWAAPLESVALDSTGNPIRDAANNQIWQLDNTNLNHRVVYPPGTSAWEGSEGSVNSRVWMPNPSDQNELQEHHYRLDNFYIMFDRFGGVKRFPDRSILHPVTQYQTHYWYLDRDQPYPSAGANLPPYYPLVNHPDESARGVLLYDREQFQQLPNTDADRRAFLRKAKPLFLSRSLGAVVEGRR